MRQKIALLLPFLWMVFLISLGAQEKITKVSPTPFSGAVQKWDTFGISASLPSDWQEKENGLYEKKFSTSNGVWACPIVLHSQIGTVTEPASILKAWLSESAIPALVGKELKGRPFCQQTLKFTQGELESSNHLLGMTVGLRFPHFSPAVMLNKKVEIRDFRVDPRVKDGKDQLVFSYSMSAKNLKGEKIYVLVHLFYHGKITLLSKFWNFLPPYDDTSWQKVHFPLDRAYLAKNMGHFGVYKLVLSVHSAKNHEILGWNSLDFDLAGSKPSASATFGELKLSRREVDGNDQLFFHYSATVKGQKGKKIQFRYTLYDATSKKILAPVSFDSASNYPSCNWNDNFFYFQHAKVWNAIGRKGGLLYCVISAYLKDRGTLLGWKVVPFLYTSSNFAGTVSAFMVVSKSGYLMTASRFGLNRSFHELSPMRKKRFASLLRQLVQDEMAVVSNASIQPPPRRPELEKLLINRKSWKYNYTSSSYYSNIYTEQSTYISSESHSYWFFHPDRTCDYEASSGFSSSTYQENNSDYFGANRQTESPNWKNIPFEVRGNPKGPYWILVRFKDAMQRHSLELNAKGDFGGEFQGIAIDEMIEGDYSKSDDFSGRVENH